VISFKLLVFVWF